MRSVSEIYGEAVRVRDNWLQITELDEKRSGGKMSIINLLTYVVSVLIYSYESILSAFEVRVAGIINSRVNGTGAWYEKMALLFQYDSENECNDAMSFDENVMMTRYETNDDSKKMVSRSVFQPMEKENGIYLKVCKKNENSDEAMSGTANMPLTYKELTAFKTYVNEIKFVGALVYCVSVPADILIVRSTAQSPIYYDDTYINAEQALESVRKALVAFVAGFTYNGYLQYQSVIDAIQEAEHIYDISAGVTVSVRSYDELLCRYGDEVPVTRRTLLNSGYLKLIGDDGESTVSARNLTMVARSVM